MDVDDRVDVDDAAGPRRLSQRYIFRPWGRAGSGDTLREAQGGDRGLSVQLPRVPLAERTHKTVCRMQGIRLDHSLRVISTGSGSTAPPCSLLMRS